MKLNPIHLPVAQLLAGRLFQIPEYQRAYSWQYRQREDLFGDIRDVLSSKRDHFMATIVTLAKEKRSIGPDEFQVADVVDGQQRLTTLVILLKAIAKAFDDGDKEQSKFKASIEELLVKGDDYSLVLLQTNHDSGHIFRDYIVDGALDPAKVRTASDQNLVDAVRDCERFVGKFREQGALVELLGCIRNRLSVIYHEMTDEAVVYTVFEMLNSRGLDVKWLDKTKSQLMASIFEYVDDDANRKIGIQDMHNAWKGIYRVLGLRQVLGDEALRFAGTWARGSRPNRIVPEEEASQELVQGAGRQVKSLVDAAKWLADVVDVVNELDGDVRRSAVTKFAHARFVAAGIILRRFDLKIREDLLASWERVTFRIYGLGLADSRSKVGEYVRLGYDIMKAGLAADDIKVRLSELGAGYDIGAFIDANEGYWEDAYNGWSEQLRYLLYRYDEHLAGERGVKFDPGQWNLIWAADASNSIEHIMPQSSGAEWVHHVGNLTMLLPGVNSSLNDRPPEEKAETYLTSGLRATIDVGGAIAKNGWNEAAAIERGKLIDAFVRKEWAD